MNTMSIEHIIIGLLCVFIAYLIYSYFTLSNVILLLNQAKKFADVVAGTEPEHAAHTIRKAADGQEKPIGVTANSGKFVPVMTNYWRRRQKGHRHGRKA